MEDPPLIPWRFCPSQFGCWKLTGTKNADLLAKWSWVHTFNSLLNEIRTDQCPRITWSLNLFTPPIEKLARSAAHCRPTAPARSFRPSVPPPPVSLIICNLCGPSCPRSRKSLSVGEATAWRRFSSREHSQAGTRQHGLAHYWLHSYSLRLRAGGGSRWVLSGTFFGTRLYFFLFLFVSCLPGLPVH